MLLRLIVVAVVAVVAVVVVGSCDDLDDDCSGVDLYDAVDCATVPPSSVKCDEKWTWN